MAFSKVRRGAQAASRGAMPLSLKIRDAGAFAFAIAGAGLESSESATRAGPTEVKKMRKAAGWIGREL